MFPGPLQEKFKGGRGKSLFMKETEKRKPKQEKQMCVKERGHIG